MQKVKKYSRQILVLFLALATVLACVFIMAPQADAAAGDYNVRVRSYTNTYCNGLNSATVRLNYTSNNGTGTSTPVESSVSTSYFNDDNDKMDQIIYTATFSGFPTYLYVNLNAKDSGNRNFNGTFYLEVYNYDTGAWDIVATMGLEFSGYHVIDKDHNNNVSVASDKYPFANRLTFSDTSDVYIQEDGASVTRGVTLTAYDQYGVEWVNAPSNITADNKVTVNSATTKTPTFTFPNAAADYQTTIRATYTNAHSSGSATPTKGVNVKIPRSITFDNLFDYNAFRNSGITNATNVSSTGFSISCDSGAETVTKTTAPFNVTGGKTYTITADITGTSADCTEMFMFFYNADGVWCVPNYPESAGSPAGINSTHTSTGTFVAPADAVTATLRFDCDGAGNTATYHNIRVYENDGVQENITVPTPGISVAFDKKFSDYKACVPTRTGYDFLGWYIFDGICYDANGNWDSSVWGDLKVGDFLTAGNYNAPLNSKWTPTNYAVTFNYDDGTSTGVNYNIESTSLALPTEPAKAGYTFTGWVVSQADGNWTADESVTSALSGKYGNIAVKPTWKANTYTLTFDVNDSAVIGSATCAEASKTVTFDSAVGTLPTPVLTGYDFDGWYTAATGGTQVTAETVYTTVGASAVYAHWTPAEYTISFNVDGGDALEAVQYDIEDTSVALPDAVRTGYTFNGWVVESTDGNWKVNSAANGTLSANYGAVTLKAQWIANDYTVAFDVNDTDRVGTAELNGDATKTVTFDSAVGAMPAPTLTGYSFDGWYTAAADGTEITAESIWTIADDTTLYAQWTPNEYSIRFDAGEGEVDNDLYVYNIEDTAIVLPTAARTGYSLVNWTVSAADGNWAENEELKAALSEKYGDITVTANWEANKYTLAYDLGDSTGVGPASCSQTSKTVTFDSAIGDLATPRRTGYTFEGWVDGNGDTVTAATVYTVADNSTITATWKAIGYTITFNLNGGNMDAEETLNYTIEDVITLPEPSLDGYDFDCWKPGVVTGMSWRTGSSYSAGYNGENGHYGNVTLTANYKLKSYTITWIVDGSETTSTLEYGSTPFHVTPVKEGTETITYVFKGWATTEDGDVLETLPPVTGDATYYAVFEETAREYTVTWVDENGNTVSTQSVANGAAIPTDVEVPAKTGYTGEWADIPATMPTEDITIKPVYTAIEYPVYWVVEGETVLTTNVAYDTVPSYTGATPTKAATAEYSYEFTGWTPEIVAVNAVETTYTAVFKEVPNEYKITWKDGDNEIRVDTVAYGSAITDIPDVPVHPDGMPGSWVGIPETMPAEDITINTKYVEGSVVTWVVGDTEYQVVFEKDTQIAYDRSTPTKAATAEYTYTFAGWATAPDGEVIELPTAGTTPVTYYAVFTAIANNYTVTWIADGETKYTETVAFGSAIPSKDVPGKTGHTGVWDSVPETMPAKDVTVTAVYTPINYTITWVTGSGIYKGTWAYGTTPDYTADNVNTAKESGDTTDYTFSGWDKTITAVEGDTTYTAQYTESARKYTVHWFADGAEIATTTVSYGSAINVINVPTKTGYDGAWAGIPETMPAADLNISAVYTAKKFTITWSMPSGNVTEEWAYDSTPEYNGETPVKASTAERDYTFTGWSPEITTVTGDKTYTAQFSESFRSYTVTYVVNGQTYKTETVEFGANIPKPEIPSIDGFTAIWNIGYITMPAEDITVTAVYTANKYTVTWVADGSTVYTEEIAFGSVIPNKTVPSKAGHTGTWGEVPSTMPAENVTIEAVYTVNNYSVTWKFISGSGAGTATYGVNYEVTFKVDPLPGDIRVTVNGTVLGSDSYNYNAETGELVISGTSITGAVSITEKAAEGYQNVVISIANATLSNSSSIVAEGQAFHTQIVPNDGYLLPEDVVVCIDGIELNSGYTYDADTGKLTINAEVMHGELTIRADCPADPNYNPGGEDCTCNCHSDSAFIQFFFKIITFLRRIFGMTQYRFCNCGAAHW